MTEQKKSVLVLDGDEFLWLCNYLYDRAYLLLELYLNFIFKSESVYLHGVYRKLFEIEKQKEKAFGVTKERIAASMIGLYHGVCGHMNEYSGQNFYNPKHEARIRMIARIPFNYRKMPWIAKAEGVLQALKDAGHRLCLLSSYDKTVWPDKKAYLGVNRFFDDPNILVTEVQKTREDFIQVSGWRPELSDKFNWWSGGNGRSDEIPILGLPGWRGLYVRRGSTSPYFEDTTSEFIPSVIADPRVINLTNIKEILPYINGARG